MKPAKLIVPGIFIVFVAVGMIILLATSDLPNDLLRRFLPGARPNIHVILQAGNCPAGTDVSLMIKTRRIVQQRLSSLGIDNAKVEVQDACHLAIDLPELNNPAQVIDLARQTGRLEFVDTGKESYPEGTILRTTGNPTPTISVSEMAMIPDKVYRAIIASADLLPEETRVVLGGYDSKQPQVTFKLEATATQRFKDFTTQAVGSYLCIVLDNMVQSCPSIQSPIPNGEGVITVGQGSIDEANRIVNLLRFGSLPYELEVIQNE